MTRTVTVGLDGSPESRAAAEWAAREAALLGLPLKLLQIREPAPEPMAQAPLLGAETRQDWTDRASREAAEGIALRHPGVTVTGEHVDGRPGEVLANAANDAELLVLGSRGLSSTAGFLLGSVGLSVVARAEGPVVLVRAGQQAAEEHEPDPTGIPSAATPFLPVVLGLDVESPDERLIEFAFTAAARRRATLRVVHGWNPPPYYLEGLTADLAIQASPALREDTSMSGILRPWRQKFPDVVVTEEPRIGTPGGHLVEAAGEACLVVVGRRVRRGPLGPRIGPVTHAVLHHATAPVAVVPYD